MHVQKLLGLLLYGSLALGCGTSSPTAKDMTAAADLAVAMPDLAMQPVDLAVAADMAVLYNGCTAALFSDQSGVAGIRTVTFGNAGNTYSPNCITIAAGQIVTFTGNFVTHPLRPGVGANAAAGSANTPIVATNTGASKAFTFPTAGIYPYNCSVHDLGGMNGVVQVK